MDLYHARPSTAPNGGHTAVHDVFTGNDERTLQTPESSRYQRLRGNSVSSIHGNKARRRSQDIYPSPQTTQTSDATLASPTSSNKLQRIGEWLRGQVQQPPIKTWRFAHPHPAEVGSPAVKKNRPHPPDVFLSADETSSQSNYSHHEYSHAQRSVASDGLAASRVMTSIANETSRPAAEAKDILMSNTSEVLRRHKEYSENTMRPFFYQKPLPSAATRNILAQNHDSGVTAEQDARAVGNVGVAAGEASPPFRNQLDSKPVGEAQADTGKRQVVPVYFKTNVFYTPVTAETWPKDLASAASRLFPGQFEPTECVIVECCKADGLQRCLRQYERIRDVMSAWDRDQNNSFAVVPRSSKYLDRLSLASVLHLENPPPGFAFQLYHSTQPGIWNIYWVTLAEMGLIFATNQPTSQPLDSDAISLCHLSDCDVYAASSKIKKAYQVPTRYCCVIKRRASRNQIPNGENSIHLFSTNIQQLGERFFELVQRWRSWYLVRGKGYQTTINKLALPAIRPSAGHQGPYPSPQSMRSKIPGHMTSLTGNPQQYGFDSVHTAAVDPTGISRNGTGSVPDDRFTPDKPTVSGEPQVTSPPSEKVHNLSAAQGDHNPTAEMTVSRQGAVNGSGDYSSTTQPETTTKAQHPSTEKKEVQSWFPSALEHTARTREVRRKPSVYRPRTAAKAPASAKPKTLPPSRVPVDGFGRKRVPRALQAETNFEPLASLAQRPPPLGGPPRQAGRGKLPYGKSIGPRSLNLSRPGQPSLNQVNVPPLPARSPKRVGVGTTPEKGNKTVSRVG